jgi:hypothetical protein
MSMVLAPMSCTADLADTLFQGEWDRRYCFMVRRLDW